MVGRFLGTADYESLVFGGEETAGGKEEAFDGLSEELSEELFGELPEGMDVQELLNELSESDFEPMIVNLELSDGSILSYEAMGVFLVEDTQYMALHPKGGAEEGDIPVILLRYTQGENDELILQQIEDDEEFEAAEAAFNRMFASGM